MRPVVLTLLGVLVVAGVLVFVLDHRSLLHRTELTICIVAVALFMFLAAGLYRGSRVQEETLDPPEPAESWWSRLWNYDWSDSWEGFELPLDEGCGGTISSILWALVAMVLVTVLALIISEGLPVVMVALYYVFYRAVRQVFRHGDECRGRLLASCGYALWYTTLYTGWLFLLAAAIAWLLPRP